jgi:hypothetical protein
MRPVVTKRHRATSSLRARATTAIRRSRPLVLPTRSHQQRRQELGRDDPGAWQAEAGDAGRYPALGVGEARDEARKVIEAAGKGKATLSGRARRALAAREGEVVDSVAAVLAEYVDRYQRGRGKRTWRQVEQTLRRELAKAGWMDRPLALIARRDVIELLDGIVDRGAGVMANRTLAYLRKMLSWSVERGIISRPRPGSGRRARSTPATGCWCRTSWPPSGAPATRSAGRSARWSSS